MKNNVDQNKVNNNTYTGTLITPWVLYGIGIFFTVFIEDKARRHALLRA